MYFLGNLLIGGFFQQFATIGVVLSWSSTNDGKTAIYPQYKKTAWINRPVFFVKNFVPFRNIISYDLMIWQDWNTSKINPIKS